jgi:hypothetical protein
VKPRKQKTKKKEDNVLKVANKREGERRTQSQRKKTRTKAKKGRNNAAAQQSLTPVT